ncbi:MAG TPA: PP2C family serine/threonine-protein phosphatase [Gemmatimonadaceae bacterium]|nr:PP2C family serine/threonine-protein phosphatase [Gemmatimonadaceae bacterium]
MIAEIYGTTNVGLIRADNQDAFLIANLETGDIATTSAPSTISVHTAPFIMIVADGVGGAASGALASSIATETILGELHRWWRKVPKRSAESIEAALKRGIDAANREIFQTATTSPEHHGMGTTATLALVIEGEAFIAQVGDSRAYLIRKGTAKQLTKDQSFVQRLIDAGRMTAKEAAQSEHRNIILQALGPEEKVVTDFYRVKLENDDAMVLCSDGLSNQVSNEDIARIARGAAKPQDVCNALIEEALHTGAPDNVTVVTARLRTVDADYRRAVSGN